jgi:hypothetical protein
MNERINELMKQATVREAYYPAGNDGHPEYRSYVSQEKFAELIIKECAIIANRADNTETEIRCMYDVITEHFGVEE